jgi:hypothetical protein
MEENKCSSNHNGLQTLKTIDITLEIVMPTQLPLSFMVYRQFSLTSSQADWYFIPSSYTERINIRTTTTADNYSTLCVVIVREIQQ